jgi:hypothetical protein
MQKRSWILLVAATIGLTASQALAADLPRKAPQQHRRCRRRLLGPDATSVPTSAGYLAKAMRISILLKSVQTRGLALLAAVRLAAIINSRADG